MFKFDNSYSKLPDVLFERVDPVAVKSPTIIKFNHALGQKLGLDFECLGSGVGAKLFSGNELFQKSEPLAMAYAGHQCGSWAPRLGDGRAVLLGEVVDEDGQRQDIQLKGSGRTGFSRDGDGRAWIGPILREYVVSEAMAALKIPTTRALAAVATGEDIYREQIVPGAILTRVSSSYIRVGTFQYLAASNDLSSLKALADYTIDRHFPAIKDQDNPYLGLLDEMISRQASLISKWMGVGFIHGVMNTDNVSVVGETLDYGPCAFMDIYDPNTVFSSIDWEGRYAYGNQPYIGLRNCVYFASSLLPLLNDDQDQAVAIAEQTLASFQERYDAAWQAELGSKIGLSNATIKDHDLGKDFLEYMVENRVDFTQAFRKLSDLELEISAKDVPLLNMFNNDTAFQSWLVRWRSRLKQQGHNESQRQAAMRSINPAVIPRNYQVEAMISHALVGDYHPFEKLLSAVTNPFEALSQHAAYQLPPETVDHTYETFCGT